MTPTRRDRPQCPVHENGFPQQCKRDVGSNGYVCWRHWHRLSDKMKRQALVAYHLPDPTRRDKETRGWRRQIVHQYKEGVVSPLPVRAYPGEPIKRYSLTHHTYPIRH